MFCSNGAQGVIYFFIQSILIDARMCVPLYLFHAVVMFRRQLQIIELEHWSPVLIYCSLLSHVFMLVTMIFLDHIFRSMVRVDLASKKASSLLCSVRHVLKGLCDGDLVLDRDQSIVDGAARLQRASELQKRLKRGSKSDPRTPKDPAQATRRERHLTGCPTLEGWRFLLESKSQGCKTRTSWRLWSQGWTEWHD